MANLGYDMETGRIVRWLKHPGDEIQRGEPILEVETDKATIDMEATQAGTLTEIVASDGAEVPVGEVIAYLDASES